MMTEVEFVSEHKQRKTPLRKTAWRQENGRALSTIEELNEEEVPNATQKNAKNPCIVTIDTDIVETVKISRDNSLVDETGEEEQAANMDKVGNKANKVNKVNKVDKVNKVKNKWRQHFTIDQFLFSLFLGLIPTTWDVFSDLRFGEDLASTNQIKAAGQN